MKRRILLVGEDQTLLLTRASLLKARWSAETAYAKDTLQSLRKRPFDIVILCHSLEEPERALLVEEIRQNFPHTFILALKRVGGTTEHLHVHASAVSTEGPQEMFKAIESLLKKKSTRAA